MEGDFEERAALCALNRIFGYEPKLGKSLVENFGGAANVFSAGRKAVGEVLGPYKNINYSRQISASAFDSAAMELEKLVSHGCCFIGYGETGYPQLLRECDDPPLGIYYKGISAPEEVFATVGSPDNSGLPVSKAKTCIAVVGTRKISSYGRDCCERIVKAMSKATVKPLVVSGLALGVDAVAHRTALENGLKTVAVMATGIDQIYPSQHQGLGEQIASTPGCGLVSDYPPDTQAVAINFIRRNRIIAGICKATLLIESKIKGGGMITAHLANSYDREVFALPGRVDDPYSQGCNLLIRQNLAEPIGDLAELMQKLSLGKTMLRRQADFVEAVREYYKVQFNEDDLAQICSIAQCIKKSRGISMDEICQRKHLSFNTLSNYVTQLECDGFITVDMLQHCSARSNNL